MRSAICKLFAFLLSLVSQLVDLVANTLIKIGTAAVEVLSEVVGAAGGALSELLSGGLLPILVIGAVAWFLLKDDDGEDKQPTKDVAVAGLGG